MKIFIFMCLFIIITTFLLFYTLLRPIKKKELEEFLQAKDKAEKEYNEISEKIV